MGNWAWEASLGGLLKNLEEEEDMLGNWPGAFIPERLPLEEMQRVLAMVARRACLVLWPSYLTRSSHGHHGSRRLHSRPRAQR